MPTPDNAPASATVTVSASDTPRPQQPAPHVHYSPANPVPVTGDDTNVAAWILGVLLVVAILWIAWTNMPKGGFLAGAGAPVVGSALPKGMVPGNWYATGNTVVVPTGQRVDTSPKPCVRDGVKGECALRKRGS